MSAPMDWLGLGGKTCVITGAGGGIGRALAINFAKAGAHVGLLDLSEADAQATAREVADCARARTAVVACDVSNPDSVAHAAAAIESALGRCDILVNNAALLRPGALDTLSFAEWNALLSVNLTGYFLCSQAFGAQIRGKDAGAIVHVASISGSNPQGASGAYSVSKAGILMLSRQIAVEWGPSGLRSNVVSPGLVETPMSRAFYDAPGVREKRSAVVPMRRIAQPQDIADAALFLASARASYINGEEVLVDGGYAGMLMNMIPRPGYD
ncbi:MAG: SDR family oxidoreductase [Hyphomicrobiales bacterium]|nr:SDR family oxidoreductase [Hyphomicrobiales bacterium]